jgi:DNA-directed RNA polymerase specialized sigma24 family protein
VKKSRIKPTTIHFERAWKWLLKHKRQINLIRKKWRANDIVSLPELISDLLFPVASCFANHDTTRRIKFRTSATSTILHFMKNIKRRNTASQRNGIVGLSDKAKSSLQLVDMPDREHTSGDDPYSEVAKDAAAIIISTRSLDDRKKAILFLRACGGFTWEDIGDIFNVSGNRCHQIFRYASYDAKKLLKAYGAVPF